MSTFHIAQYRHAGSWDEDQKIVPYWEVSAEKKSDYIRKYYWDLSEKEALGAFGKAPFTVVPDPNNGLIICSAIKIKSILKEKAIQAWFNHDIIKYDSLLKEKKLTVFQKIVNFLFNSPHD